MLMVAGARAEEAAQFIVCATEPSGGSGAFEAPHWSVAPFDAAVVLLQPVIQVSTGSVPHRIGAKMPLPGLGGAAVELYGATPSSAGRPRPYRFNEPRRHKIPRARYWVQNWPEYDRALQRRGDLTVWVTPEAIAAWCPPRTGRRGRPRDYSDVAVETGHLLRLAF